MTTLTSDQLSLLRMDTGDGGTPPAISNAELQLLFDDESADYTRTVLRALWVLLSNSAKFADYTQNESSERKSQIFKNLQAMYEAQLTKVQKGNQVAITGTKTNPPRWKDMPFEQRPNNRVRRGGNW